MKLGSIRLIFALAVFALIACSEETTSVENGGARLPADASPSATTAATPTATDEPVVASPAASPTTAAAATTDPAGDVPALTDVYAGVAATLYQPNVIYHATSDVETDAGPYSSRGTIEQWIDVERNLARTESVAEMTEAPERGPLESTSIIVGETLYRLESNGDVSTLGAPSCYGAMAAVAAVLGCPGPTDQTTTVVELGAFEDRPAIVLVTSGTSSGSDETYTFTSRLFLDATTYLPIAELTEGTPDIGTDYPLHSETRYQHERMPLADLPADFFDPVSIGYQEPDLAGRLDDPSIDIAPYWLGERFEPGAGLPVVVLSNVELPDPMAGPGYQAIVDYAAADDPHGPAVFFLQEWPRDRWDAGQGQAILDFWETKTCSRQEEITLPDGNAVIFMGWEAESMTMPNSTVVPGSECDNIDFNRFMAIISIGETVVMVDAPGSSSPSGFQPSPFNSRDGMLAIVQALQPR